MRYRQRDGLSGYVLLLLAALGVLALGACSNTGSGGTVADGAGELATVGSGSGQAASNQVTTAPPTTVPSQESPPDAPAGSDGNFTDADIPAEQFTNQPADTAGARELPATIAGYNFLDRDGTDQFSQQSQELAGVGVTIRSLDPVVRSGSAFRPQILVMKSPKVGELFGQGAWAATQKTLAGQPVWVIGGSDASTQIAWLKKSDTVVLLSGAPYSVLEPIMVDVITNAP